MFKNAKVGDRVWSFEFGWGTIVEMKNNVSFPILVEFFEYLWRFYFTFSGKRFNETKQTLFWDEIKFEIPKRKVKKYLPLYKGEKCFGFYYFEINQPKYSYNLDNGNMVNELFDTEEEAWKTIRGNPYKVIEVEIEE